MPDEPNIDEACFTEKCLRPARAAISTRRGGGAKRGEMSSTLHYDNRTAPKSATRYCRACAIELMISLGRVLINEDDETSLPLVDSNGNPVAQIETTERHGL